jgi:hypothetical protein
MLPTFIGIGAPKAGTTFIYNRLDAHPNVFVSSVKEPCYFDFQYGTRSLEWYENLFEGAEGHSAIGEFSTRYLKSEAAPSRVQDVLPDVQLIVSLRNPIDQVYSHYWHLQRQNFHQSDLSRVPDTFEQAIDHYPEKLLRPAKYAHHLRRWFDYFKRDQVHILFFEDLKQNPSIVLQELYSFLGGNPTIAGANTGQRSSSDRRGTSPRHPTLQRVHALTYKYLNRWMYAPLKNFVGVERAVELKDKLRIRELLERLFRKEGYPEMQEKTRSALREYFADDIEALEKITGRKLDHWR